MPKLWQLLVAELLELEASHHLLFEQSWNDLHMLLHSKYLILETRTHISIVLILASGIRDSKCTASLAEVFFST